MSSVSAAAQWHGRAGPTTTFTDPVPDEERGVVVPQLMEDGTLVAGYLYRARHTRENDGRIDLPTHAPPSRLRRAATT